MRRVVLSVLGALAVPAAFLVPAACSSWSGAGFTSSSESVPEAGPSSSGSGGGSGGGDSGGVMGEDAAIDCAGHVAQPLNCDVSFANTPTIIQAFVDASFTTAVPQGGTLTSGTYYEIEIDNYLDVKLPTHKTHAILVVDACAHTMEYNDNGTILNLAGSYTISGTELNMTSAQQCCADSGSCGMLDLGYTANEGAILLYTAQNNGGNRVEIYVKQ